MTDFQFKYGPEHEAQLAATRKDFRLLMESIVMGQQLSTHAAAAAKVNIEDHAHAGVLAAALHLVKHTMAFTAAQTIGAGEDPLGVRLPRGALHELVEKCCDAVEAAHPKIVAALQRGAAAKVIVESAQAGRKH